MHALHGGLMDEDPGVGQGQALTGAAGGQQNRSSGGGLPQAHCLHLRLDVLHSVVNGRQRGEGAAGTVDVHRDQPVRILGLQDQQLGHDVVGGRIIDLHPHEDDAILEELGVGVLALESVGCALLELGQHVARGRQTGGGDGTEVRSTEPASGVEVGGVRHVSCLRSERRSHGSRSRCGR